MQLELIRFALSKTALRKPIVSVRHRGLSARDVFIASYPRAGSTWLRFLLNHVLTGAPSDFASVNRNIPHVGFHANALRLPSGGRLLKTHEAFRSEYQKAIYIVRDPRDVLLSEYNYLLGRGFGDCSLETFAAEFVSGKVNGNGSWQAHARGWLNAAERNGGILIVRFEDLRRNTEPTLCRLLDFLGVPADLDLIREAVADNTVARMREKELLTPQKASRKGRFIGTGTVGGWAERLDPATLRRVERACGDEMLRLRYEPATEGVVSVET